MKMIFKAFSKKLFGAKYERLIRTVFVCLIVFWGLYISDFRVRIAPFILYLTVTAFTSGVMWQALSSEDNAANMQNMFMLPFESGKFVFSYIAALGIYTFLTKTAVLMSVLLAVSVWRLTDFFECFLCAVNAILMTAAVFSLKKYWYAVCLWCAGLLISIFVLMDHPDFCLFMTANAFISFFLLWNADGYSFCLRGKTGSRIIKGNKHCSVWVYLIRYLKSHKNYLMNTLIMWCAACVFPLFFRQMENMFVIPVGFAILSLNTPVCILLSCDHALERAVRFLPGQKKTFCIPYCLFIFYLI